MRAYRFKIKPSKRISQAFEQTLNVCRELYNAGLQERRDAYRAAGKSISYAAQCLQLPDIKKERADVNAVYSQVLQDALRKLSKSFDAFFRRVKNGKMPGYPRFKGRDRYNSFAYPQSGFRLEREKLYLSKIGSVRLRLSRQIEGTIKTCTIKREVDGWYAVFAVEENQSQFFPKTGKTTGIDVGIERFATLADGKQIENPQYFRKAERRLKTAQRNVSRKIKRSAHRKKAVRLLAKQHLKVKRQRLDFLHKESLKLVREYDQITFEDLNTAGMLKNHHLAKSIADASWNAFMLICEAKAANAGRRIVKVPAAFTSQDCSACGNRVRKTLSEREHRCIACGLVLHRDHNSAINLDIKGRAVPSPMEAVGLPNEARILPL